ncbi:hypothetical protein N7474_001266 [Penicillium riverlandense]|uniref:uncharacterized protein n=1 Tax=Penicillium riverlandense TaxID=1903569 RepID=UPI002546C4D8|nr:uncharacterized protein N7474_001266 [Penicillium riverlandense]KAJ5832955.1 hypothetical protein N7474_001266 [Penicillium riverlandense]
MAGVFKNVFGSQPSGSAGPDDDFADFVEAPNPTPASLVADTTTVPAANTLAAGAPYTKWYRVWERVSPSDFQQEAMIMPFIVAILLVHFWGTRKNRRRARDWALAHAPVLQKEFAVVGFDNVPGVSTESGDSVDVELVNPEEVVEEKSAHEFTAYASGRQNVAFVDVALKMPKRYNPITYLVEYLFSFFFESWEVPSERYEALLYTFDGKEKDLVPMPASESSSLKVQPSAYDGFIWAVVHKSHMKKFRTDRYDASMTFTKDNPKLPPWVTVMTESAEISDILLTPELIKAIEEAGSDFEYLIVTDQPLDKPTKIEETVPRKRVQLSVNLASSVAGYASTLPLFTQFLRFGDRLVASAHFRGEVMRKIRNAREEEIKKLRRLEEEDKAEERKIAAEKIKKEERDRLLRSMTADEQRKFLDRESQKGQRKSMKKYSKRG